MTQRKSNKIDKKAYINLYKEVFGSESGKLVLADLMRKGRVLAPFPMSKRGAGDIDFCEGQRQFALAILALVEYDLNQLSDLMDNYKTEVTYDNR